MHITAVGIQIGDYRLFVQQCVGHSWSSAAPHCEWILSLLPLNENCYDVLFCKMIKGTSAGYKEGLVYVCSI